MDLTPKQQTSEAIRQAETIVILTGQHPSVDQVTAVMALASLLRKFEKKVTAIISDNPPASVQALDMGPIDRGLAGSRDFVLKLDVSKVEVDKLRYEVEGSKLNIYLTPFKGAFAPSDVTFGYGEFHYDLAIVLGVPTRARIDRIYEQNAASFETIPVVNLDFHRSNENYGAVNLIEPNASSLCEMLVALSESLQSGSIDGEIATALLMGIVASTDRFTAAHTSPKSLTVAAQMMAAGARQQAVVRALYRDSKPEPRSSDRNDRDRPERPDRGPDRPAGGDRNSDRHSNSSRQAPSGQQAAPRERPAQSEPERHKTETETPTAQQRPALDPQVSIASTNVEQNVSPVSRETELPSEADLPIIQPSHIEMSEPEPQAVFQPVKPAEVEAERTAPDRPQSMPIADFAAAAEMFKREQPTAVPKPIGEES
jgi:hypothetical protein